MIEKFVYQPVKPWYINQSFGQNNACVNSDKKVISIASGQTCPTGYKSLYAPLKGHNGLDTRAYRWQPVYAAHDGIVTEVQTEVARGLGIGIVTDRKWYCKETNKPEHFKTRYWHFIAMDVNVGDKVKTGDFIGYADNTGYSSGDHLHFELKPVTILEWENGRPIYNNTLQGNGYYGAVDPLPYMEDAFALDIKNLVKQLAELSARIADFIADKLRRR